MTLVNFCYRGRHFQGTVSSPLHQVKISWWLRMLGVLRAQKKIGFPCPCSIRDHMDSQRRGYRKMRCCRSQTLTRLASRRQASRRTKNPGTCFYHPRKVTRTCRKSDCSKICLAIICLQWRSKPLQRLLTAIKSATNCRIRRAQHSTKRATVSEPTTKAA